MIDLLARKTLLVFTILSLLIAPGVFVASFQDTFAQEPSQEETDPNSPDQVQDDEEVSSSEPIGLPKVEVIAPESKPPENNPETVAGNEEIVPESGRGSGLQDTGNMQSETGQTQSTGGVLPQTAPVQRSSPSRVLLDQNNDDVLGVVSSPSQTTPEVAVAPGETLSATTDNPGPEDHSTAAPYIFAALAFLAVGALLNQLYKKRRNN